VLRDSFDGNGDRIAADRIYYLTDANHNVTSLIDASGTVVERYYSSPYGQVTIITPDWTQTRTSSLYNNTILFAGMDYDPSTELYYDRARWYNPATGTFLTRDPAAADVNLYRYCHNDPISSTDPTGLYEEYGQLPDKIINGTKFYKTTLPDGVTTLLPEGANVVTRPDGSYYIVYPNGQTVNTGAVDKNAPCLVTLFWQYYEAGTSAAAYHVPTGQPNIKVDVLKVEVKQGQTRISGLHADATSIKVIGPVEVETTVDGFTASGGATLKISELRFVAGGELSTVTTTETIFIPIPFSGSKIGFTFTVRGGLAYKVVLNRDVFKVDGPGIGLGIKIKPQ